MPRLPATKTKKSDATRAHIMEAAFRLFRKHGVSNTTMRAISVEAGVAYGLAYRYFPTKDAIVLAFYLVHHERHMALMEERLAATPLTDPGERMSLVLETQLAAIAHNDDKLLRSLAPTVMNSESPTWVFSPETQELRDRSSLLMRWVLEHAGLEGDAQEVFARGLWVLQMGILYFAVHDESQGRKRSHALIAGVGELVGGVASLGAFAAPMLEQVAKVMRAAAIPMD